MPAFTLPPDNRAIGTGNPPADMNGVSDALAAMGAGYNVLSAAYAGGADPTFASDSTAAINAADLAASATGAAVLFPPGTYKVNGALVKNSLSDWIALGGHGSVTIKLANAANLPVLTSASFASQTLTGSGTAGISGFTLRNVIFDGNAANQSVPAAFGVGIYGWAYGWDNCSVQNCLATDGLYTEFGAAAGGSIAPDKSMEATFRQLRIHDSTLTSAGWHHRGPHDSNVYGCWIYNNTASANGLWAESAAGTYTAAALSGTAVSSTPSTVTVTTTLNLPVAGSATIPSAGGTVTLSWTGTTATTLTGASAAGGSGNYSSNTLTPVCAFSGTAGTYYGLHVWGTHAIGIVADCQSEFIGCEAEGATTGQVLARGAVRWHGGRIFNPAGNTSYGLQLGGTVDACSQYVISRPRIDGFQGATSGKAYVNVVNESQGHVEALLTLSGTAQAVFGSFSVASYHKLIFEGGGSTTPAVAAQAGAGTSPPAPTVSNATDRRMTVSMGTGTTPTIGTQARITFAQPKPGTPKIMISAENAATAPLDPYVINFSSTQCDIGFGAAPAASQATGTYVVGITDATG